MKEIEMHCMICGFETTHAMFGSEGEIEIVKQEEIQLTCECGEPAQDKYQGYCSEEHGIKYCK